MCTTRYPNFSGSFSANKKSAASSAFGAGGLGSDTDYIEKQEREMDETVMSCHFDSDSPVQIRIQCSLRFVHSSALLWNGKTTIFRANSSVS